jgi:hypothetical protein
MMGRSNTTPRSIIEKNGLGSLIQEMVARGCSYNEIVEVIKEQRGITLSRMNISRYLRTITDKKLHPQMVRSKLKDLRKESISNTNILLSEFYNLSKDIQGIVERSKIPPDDRLYITSELNSRLKNIKEELIDSKVGLMQTYEAIEINTKSINDFLVSWSSNLCPECRKAVAISIQEFGDSKK